MSASVSCICVSKGRSASLKLALDAFFVQSHTDVEMVLVLHTEDRESQALAQNTEGNIRYYVLDHTRYTLGELRNYAVQQSVGDYFIVWDDDDWYHRDRVANMLKAALHNRKPAVCLQQIILFDAESGRAYLSVRRHWENTLFCQRQFFESNNLAYGKFNRHEDRYLLDRIKHLGGLYPLLDPSLYLYTFHGTNVCGNRHFQRLFKEAFPLTNKKNSLIQQVHSGAISYTAASNLMSSKDILQGMEYVDLPKKRGVNR